jgi:hypothetical protein
MQICCKAVMQHVATMTANFGDIDSQLTDLYVTSEAQHAALAALTQQATNAASAVATQHDTIQDATERLHLAERVIDGLSVWKRSYEQKMADTEGRGAVCHEGVAERMERLQGTMDMGHAQLIERCDAPRPPSELSLLLCLCPP